MNLSLLYVRVSSKAQEKEGFSLDAQEKLGYDYAQRKNLKIVRDWKVSESAWHDERIAFNQMVEHAKRHPEISNIIFDVTDRMTRNDFDKAKIYTLVKDFDKTIHFSRTNKVYNRDSGPDDVFMLDIEVAVAKKMSNDISRKTSMGMLEKAEQGLYPSVAPLGYKNNLITHLIEPDNDMAPHIKRAFSLMASGSYSLDMIADALYKEGLRGRKGNRVGKGAMNTILKNSIYYGVFTWKGRLHNGSHTPLISKELFDKVQNVRGGTSHPHTQTGIKQFNNLINCGVCHCKVSGETKKHKYIYYHCTFSKGRHENASYVPEDKLAKLFGEAVKKVTLPRELVDWLKEALKESTKNVSELQEKRRASVKSKYDIVNNRLSKLFDSKFDGEIDENSFKSKEAEYKTQLAEIRGQMDGSATVRPTFYEDACQTFELSNRLYSQYVKADYEEKAKIAKLVASNYSLIDVSLYPTYRRPFLYFTKRASRSIWLPR